MACWTWFWVSVMIGFPSVLACLRGLFQAQVMGPLLPIEVFDCVAQHRAWHSGGVPVQEAQ